MPRFRMLLAYLRSLLLAFRVIAFEKTDAAAAAVWLPLALLIVLPSVLHSAAAGTAALAAAAALFFGMRFWARRNRFRLIRTADRVEFADVDAGDADERRQRFATGVVLRRLESEAAGRMQGYSAELMEESRCFFLVASAQKTRIVPFEWIVGIEIEMTGEHPWDH